MEHSHSPTSPRPKFILKENIRSMDDFYDQVTAHLKLKDWFGRNLDALNDVLRGGCGDVEPAHTTFVWLGSQASKAALGDNKFSAIVEIFSDHSEGGDEANDIILVLE